MGHESGVSRESLFIPLPQSLGLFLLNWLIIFSELGTEITDSE